MIGREVGYNSGDEKNGNEVWTLSLLRACIASICSCKDTMEMLLWSAVFMTSLGIVFAVDHSFDWT